VGTLRPPYVLNRHCEPPGRANARPMTGSAKQSIWQRTRSHGLLRLARNDAETCIHNPAAHCARVLKSFSAPEKQRAQGKPGARCTRDLVRNVHRKVCTRAYRFSGGIPAFPARWFTAYFVLSSVNGLSCHRRPQEAFASHELDTSVAVPEPHDFAVRSSHARPSQLPRPPHLNPRS
jgi:hypothetical protein